MLVAPAEMNTLQCEKKHPFHSNTTGITNNSMLKINQAEASIESVPNDTKSKNKEITRVKNVGIHLNMNRIMMYIYARIMNRDLIVFFQ